MAENRTNAGSAEAGPLLLGIYALLTQCLEPYSALVNRLVADGRLTVAEREAIITEVRRRMDEFEDAGVKQMSDIQPQRVQQ